MKRSTRLVLMLFCTALAFVAPFTGVLAGSTGKLFVVGMGPAGPDLTTPRALDIVEKADVLLCSPRLPERLEQFGLHIDPAKVAFNPWEGIMDQKASELRRSNPRAWAEGVAAQRQKVQDFVRQQIAAGKTVAMMDGGDPTIYGPSLHYLLQGFDDALFEVVPGMGAVNAAAAALKRSFTGDAVRFVMLTSYSGLFGDEASPDESLLADLAPYKNTMVLYMSLRAMGDLVERFQKYYPADLPLAVVYFAGYEDKQSVVRSTLGTIVLDIKSMDETWLGLVIIGDAAR
jgi:precorrin-4 methylase